MPNLKQHSKRIRLSLAWFDSIQQSDAYVFINPLVNEYFYVALHMFEALAIALPGLFLQKTDYFSHTERSEELGRIAINPLNPLAPMTAPYETLSGLSRRARYIQIAERFPVSPIKARDLDTAKDSFQRVRNTIEKVLLEYRDNKRIPWAPGESEELIEN